MYPLAACYRSTPTVPCYNKGIQEGTTTRLKGIGMTKPYTDKILPQLYIEESPTQTQKVRKTVELGQLGRKLEIVRRFSLAKAIA